MKAYLIVLFICVFCNAKINFIGSEPGLNLHKHIIRFGSSKNLTKVIENWAINSNCDNQCKDYIKGLIILAIVILCSLVVVLIIWFFECCCCGCIKTKNNKCLLISGMIAVIFICGVGAAGVITMIANEDWRFTYSTANKSVLHSSQALLNSMLNMTNETTNVINIPINAKTELQPATVLTDSMADVISKQTALDTALIPNPSIPTIQEAKNLVGVANKDNLFNETKTANDFANKPEIVAGMVALQTEDLKKSDFDSAINLLANIQKSMNKTKESFDKGIDKAKTAETIRVWVFFSLLLFVFFSAIIFSCSISLNGKKMLRCNIIFVFITLILILLLFLFTLPTSAIAGDGCSSTLDIENGEFKLLDDIARSYEPSIKNEISSCLMEQNILDILGIKAQTDSLTSSIQSLFGASATTLFQPNIFDFPSFDKIKNVCGGSYPYTKCSDSKDQIRDLENAIIIARRKYFYLYNLVFISDVLTRTGDCALVRDDWTDFSDSLCYKWSGSIGSALLFIFLLTVFFLPLVLVGKLFLETKKMENNNARNNAPLQQTAQSENLDERDGITISDDENTDLIETA